jgi:hypothetical protein
MNNTLKFYKNFSAFVIASNKDVDKGTDQLTYTVKRTLKPYSFWTTKKEPTKCHCYLFTTNKTSDTKCAFCKGKGTFECSFNPTARFSTYEFGGLWDGKLNTTHTTKNSPKTLTNNLISCKKYIQKPSMVPGAIIDSTGWYNLDGEDASLDLLYVLSENIDSFIVLVDCYRVFK